MTQEMLEVSIGESFKEFLEQFRDTNGDLKYIERIRKMIDYELTSLEVEFGDMYRFNPSLAIVALENPREFLREAGEAIREVVAKFNPEYAEKKAFIPRIVGVYETIRIREVGSEHVGKLVQIEGIVTRMQPRATRMIRAYFRHEKCGGEFKWPLGDEEVLGERIEKPSICPVCGESSGRFVLIKEKSEYIDWQKIVVQEKPEDVPGGQIPRSLDAHLTRDLVEAARPGDRVKIVGIVALEQVSSTGTLFNLYLEANSVKLSEKVLEEISITKEDEERILELARDPWVRERIVASIAPAIYGHWDLKLAIALLLVGGVPKVRPDGTRVRGDIHVLFIGDPGVAKSQLLQSAAQIAPRAVFTTGKGSTAAGLTAAVIRDPKTGEYFLEAGALVLADGGVAIIDEFDKMNKNDRAVIHEAMEQQTVSIAKAGIKATLSARTSVLAAGNPKFGYYDTNKSFIDNVDLPAPIISRFDLIFIVRDVIDKEKDKMLARYVLETHTNLEKFKPDIDSELLRKYIAYARKKVKPKLTPHAKKLLEDFFVEMRSSVLQQTSQEQGQMPIPITTRQLEALVRIAEAHAKLALKSQATEEDAIAAIRLMVTMLTSIGVDVETGAIDVGAIMTGAAFHTRKLMSVITDVIKRLTSGDERSCAKLDDIVKEVTRIVKVSEDKVHRAITKMYQEGFIFAKRQDCFRVVE